ncbi:MAG: CocE/NonD family hydrolase [Acidobacteriaceae bacterium]
MSPRRVVFCFVGVSLSCAFAMPGLSQQPAAPAVHVARKVLERYVGVYREQEEPAIEISVFRDGDQLYFSGPRTPRTDLTAKSDTAFTAWHGNATYTFVTDSNGKVSAIRFSSADEQDFMPRVSSHPVPSRFRPYSREEVMIPMRDGVKLHAVILRPKDTHQPLPFLLERTPYGVYGASSDSINEQHTALARNGYIFVMEDIRGRYGSQGQFVMMRPLADHSDPHLVDESTDAWDTVDWLVKNVPENNGRVGVMGVSYPGFLAAEAGIDPNPHVKAISPQAPMTDVWLGDDFFHNGAFRQTYGYDYVTAMESSKQNELSKMKDHAYTYFLNAGSFAAAGKLSGASDLPTWKAFLDHPAYDSFWRSRAVQYHLNTVTVPTLEVGGWWDQEDLWGPQEEYAALEPHNQPNDPLHRVYMVLGPWRHGSWSTSMQHLGPVDFGQPTGDEFRGQIEAPFFAYYLKDQPGFSLQNTATFQTGSDRWMYYDEWPPNNTVDRNLYLDADGSLSFQAPADPHAYRKYVSDPANPVPYRMRPIEATYGPNSHWYWWLVEDQRPYAHRPDVAAFETPPLDHDVTVTGDVVADLIASTSGTDSDWVVKLIDVFPATADTCAGCTRIDPAADPYFHADPDGYELMIADEIFRGRYRKSFERPEAIPANTPEEYTFSLHAADHVFLKGHRIMVQVQSTWFPLYDRNPQTFVPNIMTAQPGNYVKAEQRIYAGSHIVLPTPGAQAVAADPSNCGGDHSKPSFASRFPEYVDQITNTVRFAWKTGGLENSTVAGDTAYVVFEINRNGTVSDIHLSPAALSTALNQSGLDAVRSIAAFDPLPAAFNGSQVCVQYTFQYRPESK